MIKASRSRYGVWFDLDHGASANVEVYHYGIKLRISDDNYAAEVSHADAASLLRAMLREISGPSIDDVREVWGDPRMVTRWCGAGIGHKCSWSVRAGGTVPWVPSDTFGDTEREALQAAYDAGVERRKGDGA